MTSQRQLGLKIIFLQNILPPLLIWNLKRTRENDWLQLLQRSSPPRLSPEPVHWDHLQVLVVNVIVKSQMDQLDESQSTETTSDYWFSMSDRPTSNLRWISWMKAWINLWQKGLRPVMAPDLVKHGGFFCICASDQEYQVVIISDYLINHPPHSCYHLKSVWQKYSPGRRAAWWAGAMSKSCSKWRRWC